VNPFTYTKNPQAAAEMQANANHHWFEKMAAEDLRAEAEEYLTAFRGDSVARAGAISAARDAHDAVRHHVREHLNWAARARHARKVGAL
jgi:hypothetical protein